MVTVVLAAAAITLMVEATVTVTGQYHKLSIYLNLTCGNDDGKLTNPCRYGGSNGYSNGHSNGYSNGNSNGYSSFGGGGGGFGGGNDRMSNLGASLQKQVWGT